MPRIALKPFAILFLFVATMLAPHAALADTSSADKATMKGLVQGQIDAFRRDDAGAAYGFAAPGIQAMFPRPDLFLGMVKQAYPQVYRPQSVVMGDVIDGPVGTIEKVFLTSADGQNWIALYSFEKQPDGSWKISGCQILKDTAPSI